MSILSKNSSDVFTPIINFVGKILTENEKVIGVVLKKDEIQGCVVSRKKNTWRIENYFHSKLTHSNSDDNLETDTKEINEKLKEFISDNNIKTKDVALTIPAENARMLQLMVPKMDSKDLEAAVNTGMFWQQFDALPKDMENYNLSYQIMDNTSHAEMMEISIFYADKKIIDQYLNAIRECKLNPVLVDISSVTQLNALGMILGDEIFNEPVAFLNYSNGENNIAIASHKAISVMPLNIIEADKVLLETIEEVSDISTGFWDEIFERLTSQIKNALVEFETKNETNAVKTIYFSSNYANSNNFTIGIQKQLTDIKIEPFDVENKIEFSSNSLENYNALPNKSLISEAIGIAVRKINPFDLENKNLEKFKYNLLPDAIDSKIGTKYTLLNKASTTVALLILIFIGGHLAISKIPTIVKNNTFIKSNAINNNTRAVRGPNQRPAASVAQYDEEVKNLNLFGSNKLTNATLFKNLENIVPSNIRIINFELADKKKIKIEGVSIDDVSIINFVNKLSNNKIIEDAKIEKISTITDQDLQKIYPTNANAPKRVPREPITKLFVINLMLKPVDGEKFYDQEKIAALTAPAGTNPGGAPLVNININANTNRPAPTAPNRPPAK
jgi:Tfp pilus assembly PilM family ATPase